MSEFKESLLVCQKPLKEYLNSPKFQKIQEGVKKKYMTETCYPPSKFIFNAFQLTTPDNLKVVIVGQDPYH